MAKHGNRRTQDTVEISLERGQVTTLVVGSVLGLGAAFLLGVGFGRRASAEPAPAVATPNAAATVVAEAKPAAPETVEPPPLTFHDALTGRKIEARVETPAPTKVAEAKPAPKPEAAPAKAEPAAPAKKAPEKKVAEAAPAPAKAAETAPDTSGYSVQVASSRDRDDTERLAKKLEAAGYPARVVPADIPGKGRWYRVRVGDYGSRQDAAMKQAEIKLALNLAGIVVSD